MWSGLSSRKNQIVYATTIEIEPVLGRSTLQKASEARYGYVPKNMDLPMWKKGSKESLAYCCTYSARGNEKNKQYTRLLYYLKL